MDKKILRKNIVVLIILILLTTSYTGCLWESNDSSKKKEKPGNGDDDRSEYEKTVLEINNRSVQWLDTLDIDPIELRDEMGIKGKKKFVELLDTYLVLYQTSSDEQLKIEYKIKVESIINVTYDWKYHDLNEINDTQFRQDSTSYLRAWYIIREFGFDTTYYNIEIANVTGRIDAHLPLRGINQRMAFVFYYGKLGYPINYTMEELFNQSKIRQRATVENLTELDMYYITHEVFMLYDDNKMDLITNDDINYLKDIIPELVNKTIKEKNVDLLAEFIMIMTYLDFDYMNEYDLAVEYLLSSQNADGSFGDYEYARDYYESQGISVEIQLYLHTTEVSLRALNEAIGVYDK